MSWLKIDHDLPDKPEPYQMATALGIDPDAVVGKLLRVWIWADKYASIDENEDGHALVTLPALLDRVTGVTGFAAAMIEVGWLVVDGKDLRFPHFGRHNGKTAKDRALSTSRQQKHRESQKAVTPPSRSRHASRVTSALPELELEKEKELLATEQQGAGAPAAGAADLFQGTTEKVTTEPAKTKSRAPATRFTPPTIEELGAYAAEIGMAPARAANFMDFQIAKGWKVGNSPMKCWKAALRTWNSRPDFNAPAPGNGQASNGGKPDPSILGTGRVDPNRAGRTPETQLPTDDERLARINAPPAPDDGIMKINSRKAVIAYWRRDCRDEEAAGKPLTRQRPYPWHKPWHEMTPAEKAAEGWQPYGIH